MLTFEEIEEPKIHLKSNDFTEGDHKEYAQVENLGNLYIHEGFMSSVLLQPEQVLILRAFIHEHYGTGLAGPAEG